MAIKSCLKVLENGVVTTVQFCEREILDEMRISEMQAELMSLIDAKTRPLVVIDFHNVDHMSSACLGLLVAANTRVNKKEGRLRLANIQPKLMTVFALTKLDLVLKISSTRTGAERLLTRIAEEQAMGSP
jgi:anti-anti-sigma factor